MKLSQLLESMNKQEASTLINNKFDNDMDFTVKVVADSVYVITFSDGTKRSVDIYKGRSALEKACKKFV
jgi:hypothetical protein